MNVYEKDRTELIADLHSKASMGLPTTAVAAKQQEYGKNRLEEQKAESIFKKILHNLRDVSTIILLIAAALALVMGLKHDDGYIEFVVIMGIVILNMFLAITQERSAEKSLAALKNLNSPTSLVLRDSLQQEVASEELVPGDILLLKSGDLVSADARLLESNDLAVDESALTGESLPAQKSAEATLSGKVAVADQINMVFSGCLVTAGRAKVVVVATGMRTQMGHIAAYLNNTQKLKTPLQNRIDNIGKVVSSIAVAAALLMFALGFLRGAELWEMIFVAISLAVAAVPETLALIVTLMLSHGVTEMVKKNALIRKLPAVETLGSTSIICTDKTGTLTQNRMAIKRLWIENAEPFRDDSDFTPEELTLLQRFALANNAVAEPQPDGSVKITGSPTEAAVLHLLHKKGIEKSALEAQYPRVAEISFSSERKMMTTVHKMPQGNYLVLTGGAFDRVPFIAADPAVIEKRSSIHDAFAGQALRILALGSKYIDTLPNEDNLATLENDLHFEGIIGIIDPPRPECAAAVAAAKNAGIRTVMITGDHAVTAGAIAKQVGILSDGDKVLTGLELSEMSDEALIENVAQYAVYARVSPEDKIRIVEAWQEHNEVVAMTGDGVNDAPALKAADVGIAMGIAGTEVAKSAADMVLTDDNFSTIVEAVRRGRNVFSNIRKLVYFLLVCNFSEIVIMLGAQLFGWGMPLTPIMLLLINVLGDGIPGMRLAYERSDPRIMQRQPIGRKESLFSGLQFVITKQIIAFVAVAWIGFYLGHYIPLSAAHAPSLLLGQTMTFLIVGWTSILHVFTVRSRQSMFKRTIRDNPQILYAALGMIALFALLVLLPPLHNIFGVTSMGLYHWLLVIGLSLIPTITAEIGKCIQNRIETRRHKRRLVRHRIAEE
ncbi:MAG: cation-translocating P-type ATPase [Clostridiales bacterium]|nr:cation-translocating P-type ATPase [Clostridiales bacterium]